MKLHPIDETDIGANVAGIAPVPDCPPPFVDGTFLADAPGSSGEWEVDPDADITLITLSAAAQTVRFQYDAINGPARPWLGHYNNPCTMPAETTSITFAYVGQVDENVYSEGAPKDTQLGAYIAQRKSGGSFSDLGSGVQVPVASGATGDFPVSYMASVNAIGSDAGGGETWTNEFFVSFDISPDSTGVGETFDADILLKEFSVSFA